MGAVLEMPRSSQGQFDYFVQRGKTISSLANLDLVSEVPGVGKVAIAELFGSAVVLIFKGDRATFMRRGDGKPMVSRGGSYFSYGVNTVVVRTERGWLCRDRNCARCKNRCMHVKAIKHLAPTLEAK